MENKTDWVFWIQIEKRDWFKKLWASRGSNNLNIHFYGYHISIGMPWLKHVVKQINLEDPNSIERTNKNNIQGIKIHGRFRYVRK